MNTETKTELAAIRADLAESNRQLDSALTELQRIGGEGAADVRVLREQQFRIEELKAEIGRKDACWIKITHDLAKERDDAQGELDEIRDPLPDESPCKHEHTGVSLYNDIGDIISRCGVMKKVHDEIFGEFYKAGFHSGTTLDKARAVIARALRLEVALRSILTIHWGYDGDCGAVRIAEDALSEQPAPSLDDAAANLEKFGALVINLATGEQPA